MGEVLQDQRTGVEDRRVEMRGGRRATDTPAPLHTLTTQQRRLLEAIDAYERHTGEACSGNYLARRFNLHHTTIREHLQVLHRRGWLRGPNAPAALRQRIE